MLKTVITCLQDIDSDLVTELELNQVSMRSVAISNEETADQWLKRLSSEVKEQGLREQECIVIASDRKMLQILTEAGWKCIGYAEPGSQSMDLFGCCEYVIEGWEGIGYPYINRLYYRLAGIPLVIATTEHLTIRELIQEDVSRLCEICGQNSVRAFISDIGDNLQEEAEKHSAYIEHAYCFYDYGYWGIYDRQTGELIGRCGIQDNMIDGTVEVELGYLLAEEQRGKGYAKEAVKAVLEYAFRNVGLTRIVAQVAPENTASLRVAESCGMLWEKDVRNGEHKCGLYVITAKNYGQLSVQKSDR